MLKGPNYNAWEVKFKFRWVEQKNKFNRPKMCSKALIYKITKKKINILGFLNKSFVQMTSLTWTISCMILKTDNVNLFIYI